MARPSSLVNCTDTYKEDHYLTGYTIFVWTLSALIIIANVLLIAVIRKSPGLRIQVRWPDGSNGRAQSQRQFE